MVMFGELLLADSQSSWKLGETTVIGRARDADITLTADAVSRRHCEVQFEFGQAIITDLESRNGTAVNGELLEPGVRRRLVDGDSILVAGTIQLTFSDPMATPTVPRLGRLAGVWIDPENDDVWLDARLVEPPLSARQLRLLKVLDDADGAIVSRADLIAAVWDDAAADGVTDDSVTALVKRLRARLRETSSSADALEIVRGRGIRIVRTPNSP